MCSHATERAASALRCQLPALLRGFPSRSTLGSRLTRSASCKGSSLSAEIELRCSARTRELCGKFQLHMSGSDPGGSAVNTPRENGKCLRRIAGAPRALD